jgi:PTS system galactitol-specific IIC component
VLDKIPGFNKLDVDAEGLKKKFGELGDPLVLGVIVGALIALFGEAGHIANFTGFVKELQQADAKATSTDAVMAIAKNVLSLGVIMGAVMELIPRITKLFIDGLMPISK